MRWRRACSRTPGHAGHGRAQSMLLRMTGELAPGAILGGYRIEGIVGRGGMGIVYPATQTARVAREGGGWGPRRVCGRVSGRPGAGGGWRRTQPGPGAAGVPSTPPEGVGARAVEGRADLSSRACVVYEALPAPPPFERDSD